MPVFKREDMPASVALIIDDSGNVRDKRQAVETAASLLIRGLKLQDEASIVLVRCGVNPSLRTANL